MIAARQVSMIATQTTVREQIPLIPSPASSGTSREGKTFADMLALPVSVCYKTVGSLMTDILRDHEDAAFIDRIKGGYKNAFAHIIKKYKRYVLAIVNRHVPFEEAEEVAHDAFIRVYQSLDQLKDPAALRKWMAAIATKTCYDYWRRAYRSKEVPMSCLGDEHRAWLESVASDSASVEDMAGQAQAREVLDFALSKLSAEDRMVLELVYLEGLSVREVSDLLGFSMANVKIRSFRSRRKLQKLLKDTGNKQTGRLYEKK